MESERDDLRDQPGALVSHVTITPNSHAPVDIEIHGVLTELLGQKKEHP